MQKAFFLILCGLIVAMFTYYQSKVIKRTIQPDQPVAEEELMPIEEIVQGDSGSSVPFALNADSLDQFLSEENPFYDGGFKPELNTIGVLTPASRVVLEQFTQSEFISQETFDTGVGTSPILEYARGIRVDDSAAAVAGSYKGKISLRGKEGKIRIQLVPLGANRMVYDAQWSFVKGNVARFRRIPEQGHWIDAYSPTGWVEGSALRLLIPRGAILGSGLTALPTGLGVVQKNLTGYELRGKRSKDGSLAGEVFALGRTQKLGEDWNLAEVIGSFKIRKADGS